MVKVYGLMEKLHLHRWGIIPVDVKEEHPDLWKVVESIENSRVGVELFEKALREQPVKLGKLNVLIQQIYLDLYKKLKDKNEICFLDDESAYVEMDDLIVDENASKLEKFKANIKSNYIYYIKRDNLITEQIRKQNPDFIFVGGAHAYNMYKRRGADGVLIEVPVNKGEVIRDVNMAFDYASSEEGLEAHLSTIPPLNYSLFGINDLPPDITEELEGEISSLLGLGRLYNLITKGRISSEDRTPDFIGTWTSASRIRVPAEGFFEIYLDNFRKDTGLIEGTIKDYLGDAEFNGHIRNSEIFLIKEYTKRFNVDGGPVPGRIVFEGCNKGNLYIGQYRAVEVPDVNGEFILVKQKPGIEQRIIESENREQLISQLTA